MIEMGIVVAIGLMVTFWKLSWKARLFMLSHPLGMDIGVFILLNWLHWGTYSGVMVAAVGALTCSLMLSLGRWAFGHIRAGKHVPGKFNVSM